jgi:hypothetical protein
MRGEGGGGAAGSQPMSTSVHRSPNKIWKYTSIFNLCNTGILKITSSYLGGILGEMNAALESVVEVSLAASAGQHLRLDHVLGAGKLSRDPGRLRLVCRHPEFLHRHTIVLEKY